MRRHKDQSGGVKEKQQPKPPRSRIALQLPADLDELLGRVAEEKLTNKSALVRSILADWRKALPQ